METELYLDSYQVIWSEQNRLHVAYNDVSVNAAGVASNILEFTIGGVGKNFVENVISASQTIVILDPAGVELKALVTASSTNIATSVASITVTPYTQADLTGLALTGLKIFVYGSEYDKGVSVVNSTGIADATGYKTVNPSFTQFSNSPIIIRNKFVVSGSDMAQIGWVEVATEDGTGGYLWYLKAESETRLRFEDYLEMAVVEGELKGGTSTAAVKGTQGLFAAIKDRGNTNVGFTAAGGLATFDEILKNLDTQGAIEENMLFLNRQTSLDFDDMLSAVGGNAGSSYGVFENSEDMALNLGFSGFRRGSYDFYKTDWKYLNDASTRGAIQGAVASVEGVLVPAGTSTVYDQILGTNIRRPFLHVRYRASQADDRRMKSWLTGSAGGAMSSDLDAMEVNFLSERCLCVQAANNFVLFQGV